MIECAFDNSALSCLGGMVSVEAFARRALASNSRILVPYPVLCEFVDGSSEERAIEGFSRLKALRELIGTRLVVSANLPEILSVEGRGSALQRTPRLQGDEGRAVSLALKPGPLDIQG